MLIREFQAPSVDAEKLAAMSQFMLNRAEDTDAKLEMSAASFLKLAANMGISLTFDNLRDMSQQPPLSNIIADVQGGNAETGRVIFKGAEVAPDTMSVDQAQQTVDGMAKRATKKAF